MWNFLLFCLFGISTALLIPNEYDGKYTSWSEWSQCSASCGEGTTYRFRKCKEFKREQRLPRDVRGITKEQTHTTEAPDDDEFGFVFIQDDLFGRRKPSCNGLFDKETRKCRHAECSKTGIPYTCTFDQGMCHMTQGTEDDIRWSLTFAETHIYRKGNAMLGSYIHVDPNQVLQGTAKATIATPWLQKSENGYCISFWYKMYGEDIRSMKILLQTSNDSQNIEEQEIWKENNDNSDVWLTDLISVPISNKYIKFVFEATTGARFSGEIALDDIAVADSLCLPRPWKTAE